MYAIYVYMTYVDVLRVGDAGRRVHGGAGGGGGGGGKGGRGGAGVGEGPDIFCGPGGLRCE